MKATTGQKTVEDGQLESPEAAPVAEPPLVEIVLPPLDPTRTYHLRSPRLKHPEDAAEFVKVVIQEKPDAGL